MPKSRLQNLCLKKKKNCPKLFYIENAKRVDLDEAAHSSATLFANSLLLPLVPKVLRTLSIDNSSSLTICHGMDAELTWNTECF